MMNRFILLAGMAIAAMSLSASDYKEGKLNDRIYWELNDSVLSITGRGKMPSWTTTSLVHNPFQDERLALQVREIIIGEGITEVGAFTFGSRGNVVGERVRREGGKDAFQPLQSEETVGGSSLYANLKYIELPSTLRSIGGYAFMRVPVRGIVLPEGLQKIGTSAFANSGLRFIKLPSTLKSVSAEAFSSCPVMQAADLNNLYMELSPGLFFNCEQLRMILHTSNIKGMKHGALDATPFATITDEALLRMFADDGLESYMNLHLPSRPVFKGTDEEYEALRRRTEKAFYKTESRNAAIVFKLDEKFIMPYDADSATCLIRTLGHGSFSLSLTPDQARTLRAAWPEIAAAAQPRFKRGNEVMELTEVTFTLPDGTELTAEKITD